MIGAEDQVEQLLATPEAFRRWLAVLPPEAAIGMPESLFACPLATFLTASGVQDPAVGPSVVRWDVHRDPRTAPAFMMPGWARRFVERVDRSATNRTAISAALATTLLHQAITTPEGVAA